ncbi:MAG: OmpH family outer membrane protein [Sphingomonadales bacterium]|nr:OmpH family outer membrane protein [Sphingomonadales bacterium]
MNSILKFFGVSALFVGLILAVLTMSIDKNKKADLGKNLTEKNQKLGNNDSTANTMSPIPTKEGLVFDSLVNRNGGIAFVQSEEIAVRFKLMVRQRKALQARLQKAEKEWEGEAVRFRKELEEFQRKSAAMGESQRSSTEQMLARKEQNLMQMRESIMEELSKSETVMDQELRTLLDKEFELFSKARGYRFLMARQAGSGLLYGDSLVDVTEQLVGYLNARYP